MKDFSELELDSELLRAIDEIGYSRPTVVQAQAIPHALDGKDVMASAPTGTGKTAAFLLPMIQHLQDFPRKKPGPARVLILTPTRELAIQVADHAKALSKYTNLKVFTITGGISYDEHAELLGKTQDIVVATPGRLMEYIESEKFDCRAIECLILDEADRMLDMGFGKIVERINHECRWRRQSLLFSATLEGKGVREFSETILNEPLEVNADPSRRERKKIQQMYLRCDDMNHKLALLSNIITEQAERTIIFVKTRERLGILRGQLDAMGIPCNWIQGEMAQAARTNMITRFRDGVVNVLIATDVAARGIDLPDISHVINFDMPRTAEVYLHRIGRTARAGKKGTAIALVEAHDQGMMERISRYMQEDVPERFIHGLRPKTKKSNTAKKKKKVDKKVKEAKAKKKIKQAAKKSQAKS
ncbi:ATP-dependent RNA helicase SrmB [Photobacterium iliopiscarium]|uniref:ATP-dependent RNA helicase SrmB n=1 Tax=Photobacterium iliopiscarium TaxID=56192 RepID=A0A2T3MMA8_9GAMM|nr:ATP-dependent RNA helicase SrmB [Photobacterium iliopiscarium]MCD9467008.1 ATP-dependent RNA helicase SrmB [Photobacterium iliopiscarium]MCD9486689.1 ATP-dependent RNA helicase SrmB [Photobacterium iliopiscarium]MCF2243364.1 ATP-dependent RNA helicase SrmB [Photobacterium iliopiscarium]PST95250.1 ATP-dependent RNA helicase SrmB [Photobacterium iliopiscarium]PSV97577.1 ATP-dependent RNA helicase SrmB [Photobacterium iliopiscarium]